MNCDSVDHLFDVLLALTLQMKKQLLSLLIWVITIGTYSQISFENGYYITNSNEKVACQIRNVDWKNTPIEFEYRLSEHSETQKMGIPEVKEFGVYNFSKFVRAKVDMDRSSDNIQNLSANKHPKYQQEEIFLNVLIEGEANLYEYIDGHLKRYFFNLDTIDIQPLVYKAYRFSATEIGANNQFRQQLLNHLKCDSMNGMDIERLTYKKDRLIAYFIQYHHCHGMAFTNYYERQKSAFFNVSLRPRLNSSSLTIENQPSGSRNTDFGHKLGFGLGVELEFVLPFNKNKWSIFVEPTYQSFKADKTREVTNISGQILIAEVDYNSIEIPIGVRHYFFLNSNSKLFLNFAYVVEVALDSTIEFKRGDGSVIGDLEMKSSNNIALGAGYKINDKYSVELRYLTSKNNLGYHNTYDSDYRSVSLIFGYSFL